ncbi:hypothetical protein Tco_0758846 [Tanacetum coccineum]
MESAVNASSAATIALVEVAYGDRSGDLALKGILRSELGTAFLRGLLEHSNRWLVGLCYWTGLATLCDPCCYYQIAKTDSIAPLRKRVLPLRRIVRLPDPGKFPTSEQGVRTWPLEAANESSSPGPPALTRLLALLNAPPRSKLSRIRQMQKWGSRKWLKKSEEESSWTTVYTRRKKQIEQRPPLSVRSSRSSSPTKPTTPCSSLSALAGESLRMNVGLDRGIKTSSTGRERIGESVTEMKAGVGQTVHVAKVKPIVRVRVLVQDRTVWDLLLRALEASNQPGRSRSEVYYLTKGRVSGIRGFAIPVSLRRCSRPKSHVMLSETPRTTRIEDAPLVRKHNGLACGANGDLRLQEGKRQPPSSKDFFEGGALLYSFARETST